MIQCEYRCSPRRSGRVIKCLGTAYPAIKSLREENPRGWVADDQGVKYVCVCVCVCMCVCVYV